MVFHDVSERREKEKALAASEQRFRLLGEIVPQLLWTTDEHGSFDYANERWHSYTGLSTAQTLGTEWLSAVHQEDREHTAKTMARCVESGELCDLEFRLRRHDGEYRWFVARACRFAMRPGASCAGMARARISISRS
jgi:PAS domain S-box-containing protein